MNNKQERLQQVYEYVRMYCGVHTKTEFAIRLHITQPALSAAMNGKEAYLTQNLFQKICASFPGVFNLNYLLTGEGELLLPSPTPTPQTTIDTSSMVNAIIAAKDEVIESLKRELRAKDELIASLRRELAHRPYSRNIDDSPTLASESELK